jgi:hypothetical protein
VKLGFLKINLELGGGRNKSGPPVSRRCSRQSAQGWPLRCQPYAQAALYSQKDLLILIEPATFVKIHEYPISTFLYFHFGSAETKVV